MNPISLASSQDSNPKKSQPPKIVADDLSHRLGNLLQIIGTMTSLTCNRVYPPDRFEVSEALPTIDKDVALCGAATVIKALEVLDSLLSEPGHWNGKMGDMLREIQMAEATARTEAHQAGAQLLALQRLPHILYGAKLAKLPRGWQAFYGDLYGEGETPEEAFQAFDRAYFASATKNEPEQLNPPQA
jgi:hypothetical protein